MDHTCLIKNLDKKHDELSLSIENITFRHVKLTLHLIHHFEKN